MHRTFEISLIILASLSYGFAWMYASIETHILLMNFDFYSSIPYDYIRGYVSFIESIIACLPIMIALLALCQLRTWFIPALFSLAAFLHIYVVRAIVNDAPFPYTLVWVFESFQSILVLVSILLSPFVSYVIARRLFNKSSKMDAVTGAPS